MSLIENILGLIEETGIKPKAAAAEAGLGATAIYDILKGRNKSPRLETLQKIARVYGVTVEDLTSDKPASDMIKDVTKMMLDMTPAQQAQARAVIDAMRQSSET